MVETNMFSDRAPPAGRSLESSKHFESLHTVAECIILSFGYPRTVLYISRFHQTHYIKYTKTIVPLSLSRPPLLSMYFDLTSFISSP